MTRARLSRWQFLGQYNLTDKKEKKANKAMHIHGTYTKIT